MAGFKSFSGIQGSLRGIFAGIKKWQVAATAVVVTVLVLSALWGMGIIKLPSKVGEASPAATESGVTSGPPRRSGGGGEASWAYAYHSVDDLCTHSDIIAIGTVKKAIESREEGTRLYMTYWAFRVEEVLKGKETGELTVVQMGSPDVPGSDMKADPLFLPGDRYLLFLKESSTGNLYFHPQGRFMVWENKVYSMNYILADGASLRPVPELNLNGVDLDIITGKVTGIVDSVQLLFTRYKSRLPGDIMRYPAGVTLDVYANLSTGKNGPGKITYSIDKESLPEGLIISIRLAEFSADPYTEYESRLIIMANVPPGTYRIPLEYHFEGVGSGSRSITLHTYSVNPEDTVTDEELIERGLKPPGGK